jgi:hypothetical protein
MLDLSEVFESYYKAYESDGWKVTKDTVAPNHINLLLSRDYEKGKLNVVIKAYIFSLNTEGDEDIRYGINIRQIHREIEGKDTHYKINEIEHIISNDVDKFMVILKNELNL